MVIGRQCLPQPWRGWLPASEHRSEEKRECPVFLLTSALFGSGFAFRGFCLFSSLFGSGFAGPFFAGLQIEEVQPALRVDFFISFQPPEQAQWLLGNKKTTASAVASFYLPVHSKGLPACRQAGNPPTNRDKLKGDVFQKFRLKQAWPKFLKTKTAAFAAVFLLTSALEGTRTPNQQNRNLSFYPIELRVQLFPAVQRATRSMALLHGEINQMQGLILVWSCFLRKKHFHFRFFRSISLKANPYKR